MRWQAAGVEEAEPRRAGANEVIPLPDAAPEAGPSLRKSGGLAPKTGKKCRFARKPSLWSILDNPQSHHSLS